jgi:outer membrane protein assembly factor BamA
MRGNHMWLASAEYRLPLAHIERGLGTAPIWLRSIAITVFVEAGQVFNSEDYADFEGSEEGLRTFWRNTRPALGVELVGDMIVGWGAYLQGRVGYALGSGEGALTGGTFYAQVGSSF